MLMKKIAGLLYILFGLLLIIYPMFSSAFLSMAIGFALVFFGISAIIMGVLFTNESNNTYSILSVLLGFISVILGISFIFLLNALPFLVSFKFYIIGFIMIIYAIMGLFFLKDTHYKIRSVIFLILGILTVLLATFAASQPILIAILVGVALIIEGVFVLVIDRSQTLIEKYG